MSILGPLYFRALLDDELPDEAYARTLVDRLLSYDAAG